MASLSEILELKKYNAAMREKKSPMQAVMRGREQRTQEDAAKAELAMKLLALQQKQAEEQRKQAEEQRKQAEFEMNKAVLQAEGLIPYDDREETIARNVANNSLGQSDTTSDDLVKTNKSKTDSLIRRPDKYPNKKISKTIKAGDATYRISEKDQGEIEQKIYKLAKDMATSDYGEPTTLQIEKYVPKARELVTGEKPKYNRPSKMSPKVKGEIPKEIPIEEIPEDEQKFGFWQPDEQPKWNERTQQFVDRLRSGTEADINEFVEDFEKFKAKGEAEGIDMEAIAEHLIAEGYL